MACFCLNLNHLFLAPNGLSLTIRLQVVFSVLCWLFSIRVSSSTHGPSTLLQGPTAIMPSSTVGADKENQQRHSGDSCDVTFSRACSLGIMVYVVTHLHLNKVDQWIILEH